MNLELQQHLDEANAFFSAPAAKKDHEKIGGNIGQFFDQNILNKVDKTASADQVYAAALIAERVSRAYASAHLSTSLQKWAQKKATLPSPYAPNIEGDSLIFAFIQCQHRESLGTLSKIHFLNAWKAQHPDLSLLAINANQHRPLDLLFSQAITSRPPQVNPSTELLIGLIEDQRLSMDEVLMVDGDYTTLGEALLTHWALGYYRRLFFKRGSKDDVLMSWIKDNASLATSGMLKRLQQMNDPHGNSNSDYIKHMNDLIEGLNAFKNHGVDPADFKQKQPHFNPINTFIQKFRNHFFKADANFIPTSTQALRLLLEVLPSQMLNHPDHNGCTPLHILFQKKRTIVQNKDTHNAYLEVFKLLLENGAHRSLDVPDKMGNTPLFLLDSSSTSSATVNSSINKEKAEEKAAMEMLAIQYQARFSPYPHPSNPDLKWKSLRFSEQAEAQKLMGLAQEVEKEARADIRFKPAQRPV